MRAFAVFVVTFIMGTVCLVFAYHAFLERASVTLVTISVLPLGFVFGAVMGCWNWVRQRSKTFLAASALSALGMLLPFVVITYGYGLVLLPLVLLWGASNYGGLLLTKKLRTPTTNE